MARLLILMIELLAMFEKIQETVSFIKERMPISPRTAVVLGSGLGGFTKEIDVVASMDYKEIPNFSMSTVEGHRGRMIFGRIDGTDIIALDGRFHYYEGYSMQEVTFPVRVLAGLGIANLLVSNASGGVNPELKVGDLMIITDHINFMPDSPLRGRNNPIGPRFPSMHNAYDAEYVKKALDIAEKHGIEVRQGVYLADQGPAYETPAEYRMYRIWGADAVGMSTVPEVIAAVHSGMRVFGLSVITDIGYGDVIGSVNHEEVQKVADLAHSKLTVLFRELIASI